MEPTKERRDYPSMDIESEFGPIRLIINPDGAVIRIEEDRPITINRIAYYGTIHITQRPHGYQVTHAYVKRAGYGRGAEPTSGALSIMYKTLPALVEQTLQRDPSLLIQMRAAELHNAIHERQITIEARDREIATLKAEITALKREKPEDGKPYMAAYWLKGRRAYQEPERLEFRAPNDIAAAAKAQTLAPSGAERYSIYALPAAGIMDKARDLGSSYWVSND